MIYRIELNKKVSAGAGGSVDQSGFPPFSVIGYFDYLTVREVQSFEGMSPDYVNQIINGEYTLTHSIYVMDIPSKGSSSGEKFLLEREDIQKEKLYLISAFKLNFCACMDYQNSSELFSDIKDQIIKLLRMNGHKGNVQVMTSFGSFDIVVISAGTDARELVKIPNIIRAYNIKENILLFEHSTSFFTMHKELNLSMITGEVCASFMLSFASKAFRDKKREDINQYLRKTFQCQEVDSYVLLGDYDCQLVAKDCPMKNLLGVLNRPQQGLKSFLEEGPWNENDIQAGYTYIKIPYFEDMEFLSTPTEGQAQDQSEEKSKALLQSLEALYKEVEPMIPLPMIHTLNICMDTCRYTLSVGWHRIMALRMAHILKTALEIIREIGSVSMEPKIQNAVLKCLRGVSLVIPMAMQSDDIRIDHIDGEELDLAGDTGKFLYAYENIFNKIFQRFSVTFKSDNKKPLIFLTIGNSFEILSDLYFNIDYKFKVNPMFSVNFPDASYFDPGKDAPYCYHELFHYFPRTDESRKRRNMYLGRTLDIYLYKKIEKQFEKANIHFESKNIEFYVSAFSMRCGQKLDDETLHSHEYQDKCVKRLIRTNAIMAHGDEIFKNTEKANHDNLRNQTKLISRAFTELLLDPEFVVDFADVFKESRADIIMARVCGLSAKDYLLAMYEHMKKNKIDFADDTGWTYRCGAVLISLLFDDSVINAKTVKEEAFSRLYRITLPEDKRDKIFDRFKKVYDLFKSEGGAKGLEVLTPIAQYLIEEKENITDEMLTDFRIPCAKSDLTLEQTVEILMDEWYNSMQYWWDFST